MATIRVLHMNPVLHHPTLYGHLVLLCGLTLVLAWYLDWWKKNHK